VLNHKRAHLRMLEERFRITITISADETVAAQQAYVVDRGEQMHSPDAARQLAQQMQAEAPVVPREDAEAEPEDEVEETEEAGETEEAESEGEAEEPAEARESDGEPRRRRRRRGGRGRGRDRERDRERRPHEGEAPTHETTAEHAVAHEDHDGGTPEEAEGEGEQRQSFGGERSDDNRRRRRRGRRGGRRNRHRNGDAPFGENGAPDSDLQHAVEDMDGGPAVAAREPDESRPAPRREQPVPTAEAEFAPPPQAPAPQPAPAASFEPPHAEPPRRRSTIREPAPVSSSDAPVSAPAPSAPAPEPVVSSTAPEPASPKRGWWGKRLLGGN
jgi:ribonuclease E